MKDKIIYSGFTNWLIDVWISADTGRVTISRFPSDAKAGITRNCDFLCFKVNGLSLMTHLLANLNQPAVSPTYFPGSKSKVAPLMLGRLFFKAHKKIHGSTSFIEFFLTAMLRLIARNMEIKYLIPNELCSKG